MRRADETEPTHNRNWRYAQAAPHGRCDRGVQSGGAVSLWLSAITQRISRPVVDSYNTDMAAYEIDRAQCVNVGLQAQAEYERQQQAQRESNMTIGLIVGAIAGAAVGSVSGDAGDGAVVGGTMGALEGGLADTDYDPVTSPRKIVDRCMKNHGYELLSDLGKGM